MSVDTKSSWLFQIIQRAQTDELCLMPGVDTILQCNTMLLDVRLCIAFGQGLEVDRA